MNSALKSLQRSLLLGSCLLLAGGALHAQNPPADPSVHAPNHEYTVNPGLKTETKQLESNLATGAIFEDISGTPTEALSAPLSIPLGVYPLEDACTNLPHAFNGIHYNNAIAGDNGIFPDIVLPGANVPYQHPAPEAVLQFSAGCTDKAFANWKLSSRDAPRSRPAIPHGPLIIQLRTDVGPVDFVELMFDGKPLEPAEYANVSPLTYKLPCPAAGQHWLQARYLSGNLWSHYSNALRFEVRLPKQPRIIAACDSDRDPTPLARHGLTSITTGSIKVHLADVASGDSIVAYIDGKPVSPQLTDQSCCRIIKVEGLIAPGVHKLVVRTVGCPGSCSITSQPSNTLEFHYYDEGVYLLRPGANCRNDKPAVHANCVPAADSAMTRIRPNSQAMVRFGTASAIDVSKSTREFTFVNLLLAAPNPKLEAAQLLEDAQRFRDLAAADAATVKAAAEAVANHASATSAAAGTAEDARDNALAARKQSELDAKAANSLAAEAAALQDPELADYTSAAMMANGLAQAALLQAQQAYTAIDQAAKLARSRADACQSQLNDAVKTNAAASELLRVANEALAKAQVFANDAEQAQDVSENPAAAEQARKKTEVELGKIQHAQQTLASHVAPSEGHQLAATELRRLGDADLTQAQRQLQLVISEAKTVGAQMQLVRGNYQAASALAGHLRDPGYQLARSHAVAAQSAYDRADDAARHAARRADAVNEKANAAKLAAETARGLSADSVNALARASDAASAALEAAQRADAAVKKADIEAARFPDNSPQANVAQRATAAARAERDAAYTAATEARAAYDAAQTCSTQVAASAGDADQHATAALASAADAQHHAQAAAVARDLVRQARDRAEQATAQLLAALTSGNNVASVTADSTPMAAAAKVDAEQQSLESERQETQTEVFAARAANEVRMADAAGERARVVAKVASQAVNARLEAITRADAADSIAAAAGRNHQLQSDLTEAWDKAEVTVVQNRLVKRVELAAASLGKDDADVQRAEEGANVAEMEAARAEARAAARIREYEANARTARAEAVVGLSSPFVFASAAHFPIREFGPRGESLDREGVVIYEDMTLHFDRHGNYEVDFRASTPQMPVTIRFQFQIQSSPGRPWYTVTLAPIEFPYPPAKDEKSTSLASNASDHHDSKECCGEVRRCVCKGHSEILRRCYGEMGQGARIRRSGTARFGFGVNRLDQG